MRESFLRLSPICKCLRRLALYSALLLSPGIVVAQPVPQLPQQPGNENAPNTKPIRDHKETKEVSDKLQKAFDPKNAAYTGSNIQSVVDDQTVTLNGTVKDQGQHEMALQLARAYAGNRKIVDRLTVQP